MAREEVTRAFWAMNTEIAVTLVVEPARRGAAARAGAAVEAWFKTVEARLSRFRPDSDLSRLNRSAGRPYVASDMLIQVVSSALDFARTTDGAFDPTILPALVAAGYDRSFEALPKDGVDDRGEPPRSRWSWRDVVLDLPERTITLPAGCAIDLGGIAKGWAVDEAAKLLERFPDFAVDAGGDLRVRGVQADGQPWTVGVQDPRSPGRDLVVFAVRDLCLATSTTARRTWLRNGQPRHHLIDPRTGGPSETGVVAATVISTSVMRAEVFAKAALIHGQTVGLAFLNGQADTQGLLVLHDGRLLTTTGLTS